jgi:hypothetical protein
MADYFRDHCETLPEFPTAAAMAAPRLVAPLNRHLLLQ